MSPAPKAKGKMVTIELPMGDVEVWAALSLTTETRHKRLQDACRLALQSEKA